MSPGLDPVVETGQECPEDGHQGDEEHQDGATRVGPDDQAPADEDRLPPVPSGRVLEGGSSQEILQGQIENQSQNPPPGGAEDRGGDEERHHPDDDAQATPHGQPDAGDEPGSDKHQCRDPRRNKGQADHCDRPDLQHEVGAGADNAYHLLLGSVVHGLVPLFEPILNHPEGEHRPRDEEERADAVAARRRDHLDGGVAPAARGSTQSAPGQSQRGNEVDDQETEKRRHKPRDGHGNLQLWPGETTGTVDSNEYLLQIKNTLQGSLFALLPGAHHAYCK